MIPVACPALCLAHIESHGQCQPSPFFILVRSARYVCKYCLCSQHACMGGSFLLLPRRKQFREVVTWGRSHISKKLGPLEVQSLLPCQGLPRGQRRVHPLTPCMRDSPTPQGDKGKQEVPVTLTFRVISPGVGGEGLGRGTRVQGMRSLVGTCSRGGWIAGPRGPPALGLSSGPAMHSCG